MFVVIFLLPLKFFISFQHQSYQSMRCYYHLYTKLSSEFLLICTHQDLARIFLWIPASLHPSGINTFLLTDEVHFSSMTNQLLVMVQGATKESAWLNYFGYLSL